MIGARAYADLGKRGNGCAAARCALRPVMMTGASSRPTKPRPARAPRSASRGCPVMWWWQAAVISPARAGGGDPDRHHTAPTGDLLQRAVQTRGPGSERMEDFQDPAPDGRGRDGVASRPCRPGAGRGAGRPARECPRPPRARPARARDDARPARRIREIHKESDGTYGIPRVTVELKAAGIDVNHKRVERVMRRSGVQGRTCATRSRRYSTATTERSTRRRSSRNCAADSA